MIQQTYESRRQVMRAFTMIELLVAMAITTLLAALLIPALQRTKALARQAVCQSQLRQWGMAFSIYAGETGFYPHVDGLDRQGDNRPILAKDWADHFGWVDLLPPLMGERPWRDYGPWEHPETGTVFQCPTARLGSDRAYRYRPQRSGFFSYAMNSCLELDENCWHHPADTQWPMPSFLKATLIRSPSRVVLLFDQLLEPEFGYNATRTYDDAGKYCGSYPKGFSARHARPGGVLGGLILFCDYHVEWRGSVWKTHWPNDLEVPPRDDLDWYPYP